MKLDRDQAALRRLGRDGDCPAPREDSVAVKATYGMDRRSAVFGNILKHRPVIGSLRIGALIPLA